MGDQPLPPIDLDAEASVLAESMSDDTGVTFDEMRELLVVSDFYSESNKYIYESLCELREAGQPIDLVSVSRRLRDKGKFSQAYFEQISMATPAALNVRAHAHSVKDKSRLRQAIAQLTTLRALAYTDHGAAGVQEFLERAEGELGAIAHSTSGGSLGALQDLMAEVTEAALAAKERGSEIIGVPTGFDLDKETSGLHAGDFRIIAARPGIGKAQPLTAKVLTPTGWRQMGELAQGDLVIGADGKATRIVAVHERGVLPVFRVMMSDGWSTECCDEHLWLTRTRRDRRGHTDGSVKSLSEIRKTLERAGDKGANHSLQYMAPAEFEAVTPLELDPYLLGIYLGDGSFSGPCVLFSNPETDLRASIESLLPTTDTVTCDRGIGMRVRLRRRKGLNPSGLAAILRQLGLQGRRSDEKFIPPHYLRAPIADRVALLQGLCDTDGYVTTGNGRPGKSIEYCTTSPRLRDDVVELVGGLGGYVTWTEHVGRYLKDGVRHEVNPYFRIILAFPRGDVVPVRSVKHVTKYDATPHRLPERFIRSVEPLEPTECRCITVENPDGLYVTDGYIVTHNSALLLDEAVRVARKGYAVAFFSLEMPRMQLGYRMVSSVGRLPSKGIRAGKLEPAQWQKFTDVVESLRKLPFWIDDTAELTLAQMRARVRRLQAEIAAGKHPNVTQNRIGVVYVDYLQLLQSPEAGNKYATREVIVSSISRGLKRLAKELDIPMTAAAQLNREVEKRSGRRPQLSDLRESGSLEMDADTVIFIYRDDYYNSESEELGIAELNIAKQRNGATGVTKMRFTAEYTRFDNLAQGQDYVDDLYPDNDPGFFDG